MFGPQCRSGRVQKILLPSGFDPWTVHPVASRSTYYAIPTHQNILILFRPSCFSCSPYDHYVLMTNRNRMFTTKRTIKAIRSVTLQFHNNHSVAHCLLKNSSHNSVLLKDTVSCSNCMSSVTNERPRSTGGMILTWKPSYSEHVVHMY